MDRSAPEFHFSGGGDLPDIELGPACLEADGRTVGQLQIQLGHALPVALVEKCGEGKRVRLAIDAQAHIAGAEHEVAADFAPAQADEGIADVEVAIAPGEPAGQLVERHAAEGKGTSHGRAQHPHAAWFARFDLEVALHGRRGGERQLAPWSTGTPFRQPRCGVESGTPIGPRVSGCHVPLAGEVEAATFAVARGEALHGEDALHVGGIQTDVAQPDLAVACFGGRETDSRQLQRFGLAGAGSELQLQLRGIIPEFQCLDDLENAGQFLRNDQRCVPARPTVQHDLSAGHHIDPLQVEARQRHADHPVGQH